MSWAFCEFYTKFTQLSRNFYVIPTKSNQKHTKERKNYVTIETRLSQRLLRKQLKNQQVTNNDISVTIYKNFENKDNLYIEKDSKIDGDRRLIVKLPPILVDEMLINCVNWYKTEPLDVFFHYINYKEGTIHKITS